jgi:CcmD family protein
MRPFHVFAQPAPPGSAAPSVDDRSTAFRPVEGGSQMQSGERLVVEAYAAIWLIVFAFVLFSWRRQRHIDQRVTNLEGALQNARRADRGAAAKPSASDAAGGEK